MERLNCKKAKELDLVDYLATLGYQPKNIRNHDYWYLSPFRNERTASFKVDRKLNVWYDHGVGKGGNIIDFGILFHRCTVEELLEKLRSDFSFHQPSRQTPGQTKKQWSNREEEKKIIIISEKPITAPWLCNYLLKRRIPVDLANKYCRQIEFQLYQKIYTAIGFKNDSGGFEIRNAFFKSSSKPKDITFIDQGANRVNVFEGFFNFLSFMAIHQNNEQSFSNALILNSLSFFDKSLAIMQKHDDINLFLDQDESGKEATKMVMGLGLKCKDCSGIYHQYKDLNNWVIQMDNRGNKNYPRNI